MKIDWKLGRSKTIHLFNNTSLRTCNIYSDLEQKESHVVMGTSKYEVSLMFKQKPPIPYQFQSALWVHQPRLCLQVLYIKKENVVTAREGGREREEGEHTL
jgi:hypothetical protein